MSLDFLILGGYGVFVWSAFIFTFVSCFSLYIKTRKELKNQEKIFLTEFKELTVKNIKVAGHESTPREALSGSQSI